MLSDRVLQINQNYVIDITLGDWKKNADNDSKGTETPICKW